MCFADQRYREHLVVFRANAGFNKKRGDTPSDSCEVTGGALVRFDVESRARDVVCTHRVVQKKNRKSYRRTGYTRWAKCIPFRTFILL